jgi:hypothetical protein
MSQDCFLNLALLSVEKHLTNTIDSDTVREHFLYFT